MSALLAVPKLRFESHSRRRYKFFDESNNVLASVEQIEGGAARGRLGRMFANERDYSPVLLRISDASAPVTFTLERPADKIDGGPGSDPVLRTADGAVVGKTVAEPLLTRDDPMPGEVFKNIAQERWRLVDDRGTVLCDAEQKVIGPARWIGAPTKKVDYRDPAGEPIAKFDGKWIEFQREVPVNLRMLVVASPVAFDLLDGA